MYVACRELLVDGRKVLAGELVDTSTWGARSLRANINLGYIKLAEGYEIKQAPEVEPSERVETSGVSTFACHCGRSFRSARGLGVHRNKCEG